MKSKTVSIKKKTKKTTERLEVDEIYQKAEPPPKKRKSRTKRSGPYKRTITQNNKEKGWGRGRSDQPAILVCLEL